MAGPRLTVEAPAFVPAGGGILSSVTVQDVADPHVSNGVTFLSGPECGFPGFAPGLCEAPQAIEDLADATKVFTGFDTPEGEPFAVYKGIECWLDGDDDYRSAARAALEAGESHAVEIAFETLYLDHATVIGQDPVSATEALALAEQWAGEQYPGQAMLHTSRYGAIHLAAADLVKVGLDGSLTTALGTPVVVGSGYTANTGTQFPLWVTGQVTLWKGPLVTPAASDIKFNKGMALAERVWSATVDCGVVGQVVVDTAETINVVFLPAPEPTFTLQVDVVGEGSVTVDPEEESYTGGTEVTLTPVAESGWTFDGWSGDASGSDDPLTVEITADTSITATFTEDV